MARPKKNSVDYFPHDSDARNDTKIRIMRHRYGNTGYAFYFILLELIYGSNGFLDLSNNLTLLDTAITIGIDELMFNEMLGTAIDLGLFDSSFYKTKILTSNGIGKRIELINKERAKWRNYKTGDFSMEQTQNLNYPAEKTEFSTMENRIFQVENAINRKVKEKENTDSTVSDLDFQKWFLIYDKNEYSDSEQRCRELWQLLSESERSKAIEVVAAYVRATPDKRYRKNPINYLLTKRFNDVINTYSKNTTTDLPSYIAAMSANAVAVKPTVKYSDYDYEEEWQAEDFENLRNAMNEINNKPSENSCK